jgi:type I restriction enzyme M protein
MFFLKIFSDKDKELELLDDNYVSHSWLFHWVNQKRQLGGWWRNDRRWTIEFARQLFLPCVTLMWVQATVVRLLYAKFWRKQQLHEAASTFVRCWTSWTKWTLTLPKTVRLLVNCTKSILKGLQSAGNSGEFYTRAITSFITEMINPSTGKNIRSFLWNRRLFDYCHRTFNKPTALKNQSIAKIYCWEYKPLPHLLATTNLILHWSAPNNVSRFIRPTLK